MLVGHNYAAVSVFTPTIELLYQNAGGMSRSFSDGGDIFSSCISFCNTFSCTSSCISFCSEYALCICRDDYGIDYCEYASNGHSIHRLHSTRGIRYSILHTHSVVCGWGGQKHILTGVLEIKLR